MVRAYVIHLIGHDGRRGSVSFDRYGSNSQVFAGRTDEQALNHATSEALGAAIRQYGPNWLASYRVHTVDS